MQRSDLETEIGRKLNDPNHDRWDTGTIRSRIEQAQSVIQAMTNAVKTVETLTPTADTAEVSIDADCLDILRVTITDSNGDVHVLEGVDREYLDFYQPNWENQSPGTPTHYYFDATQHELNLVPKPSSDWAISNALKVWEVLIPTPLSGDDSEPFEGNSAMQAYVGSIIHWVTAECWQDDATPESIAKSQYHRSGDINKPGEFEKYIKLINANFDSPSRIPQQIKWAPQGGRIGWRRRSKSSPFA